MNRRKLEKSNLLIFLFFIGLTSIGLVSCFDYGIFWDGPNEIAILISNIKEYAFRIVGHDSRFVSLFNVPLISESVERDHGLAPYYLLTPILFLLRMADNSYQMMMFGWYIYTFLLFMGGVIALYVLSLDLFSSKPLACFSALLLYLSPRMFAEGHYNNKDVVLMSLILITIALGIRFIRRSDWKYGVLFSVAGAFAANTKIVGLWAWGMVGIFYILILVVKKRFNRHAATLGIAAVAVFCLLYVLLTPAMWQAPLAFMKYLVSNAADFSRWDGLILFDGEIYRHSVNGLPGYYLLQMFALTTPVYTTLLIMIGLIALSIDAFKKKGQFLKSETHLILLMITIICILPLAYAVIARTRVYNGWRHFYFIYGPLLILASYGMAVLKNQLAVKPRQRFAAALLIGCLAFSALGMIINHPFEFAYYNFLAGKQAGKNYELDYWNVSAMNLLDDLLESRSRDQTLALTISGVDAASDDGLTKGWVVLPDDKNRRLSLVNYENYREANYLLVNPTYSLLYGWKPTNEYRKLLAVHSYGHEIMIIYEKAAGG
ncbi:MAG TPA: glycosyltransferase family 39 protein [Clostridia bacterium]